MELTKLESLCSTRLVVEFCCQPVVINDFLELRVTDTFSRTTLELEDSSSEEEICICWEKVDAYFVALNQRFIKKFERVPPLLRKALPRHLINNIFNEMSECRKYYSEKFNLPTRSVFEAFKFPNFTCAGTLDRIRVAKDLVRNESIGVLARIAIAVDGFLKDDILDLLEKMTDEEKESARKGNFQNQLMNRYHSEIFYLATNKRRNYKYIFDTAFYACLSVNEVLLKNIWPLLTSKIKETVLMISLNAFFECADIPHAPESIVIVQNSKMRVMTFLIQSTNKEAIKGYIHPDHLNYVFGLKMFLFWPYQEFFLKILNALWEKISFRQFYEVMHSLADIIEDHKTSHHCDYEILLRGAWSDAPAEFKNYVISLESEESRPTRLTPRFFTYIKDENRLEHVYKYGEKDEPLSFLLSRLFRLGGEGGDASSLVALLASSITKAEEKEKIASLQGEWLKLYM